MIEHRRPGRAVIPALEDAAVLGQDVDLIRLSGRASNLDVENAATEDRRAEAAPRETGEQRRRKLRSAAFDGGDCPCANAAADATSAPTCARMRDFIRALRVMGYALGKTIRRRDSACCVVAQPSEAAAAGLLLVRC